MGPKKKPEKKQKGQKELKTTNTESLSAKPMSQKDIQKNLPILQKSSITITPEQFEALVIKHAEQLVNAKQEQEIQIKKIETNKDLEKLNNLIHEYLNSFIILGYTMQDERVLIQHVSTHKDRDALMELMKNIFLNMQQNGGVAATPNTDESPEEE